MKAQDSHSFPYEELIDLPRPVSKIHPPMARMDRAAQFNPFAALTGYEQEIKEAARLTEEKIELGEDEKRVLDKQLQYLYRQMQLHPQVEAVYFVKDEKKAGGEYHTQKGRLKKIDAYRKLIIFMDNSVIAFADLRKLECDLFDSLAEDIFGG